MLNELSQLADSLEKANIFPKDWHPQLKPLPIATNKKSCFKISIAEDGSVHTIDKIDLGLVPQLKKWEPNLGNSFPGMNIQALYWITAADRVEKILSWKNGKGEIEIELLKTWCSEAIDKWAAVEDGKRTCFLDKLYHCIGTIPSELLGKISETELPESGKGIKSLAQRVTKFPQIKKSPVSTEPQFTKTFREALEAYLWKQIAEKESTSTVLTFLVGDKKPSDPQSNISVFLDISDWTGYPVANINTIDFINTLLMQTNDNEENVNNKGDAFGSSISGKDEKLPGVKLPVIAEVKLRAMFEAHKCQYRYGTIEAESFPIGLASRKRTKGALEWLADPTREGETWGRADSRELIFAYPAILPKISIKLAACFGAQKPDNSAARFANAAQDAIAGLSGITKDLRNLEIRVFALKKMDKARTKVVFYRNYTAQRLVDAAKDWQDGCTNIPEIKLRAWGEKKGECLFPEMLTPFPLQIASCLNRVWKLDGTSKCETSNINQAQGIELLLEEHPKRFVPHLLSVVLQNGKSLVLSIGCTINKGEVISIKGYDSQKLLIPPILGLLLHKLGSRKEHYMSNTPFLVGRMLKLADELHALWSKEVRDDKLPPQLIGNSLMTAALDSPAQSLAQLALRLKPYYGWAQTTRSEKNAGLARYFVGLYGEVAAELAELELPGRFTDPERAQLLLGYLAANPKKSKDATDTLPKN